MGGCLATALFLNARSFRYAPIYLNAPCQFLQFLWGGLAQYFLYGKGPDKYAIFGAMMIIGSNLLIILFQYRTQKRAAA